MIPQIVPVLVVAVYEAHPTRKHLVTAEAVRKVHPDKCCDQIADNILDEILRQDPNGRAAIKVMISRGKVMIAGEIAANMYRKASAPAIC